MIYNSGSAKVKVGSAEVRGNSTAFSTYASVGNLFKLTGDSTSYEIAAITTATQMTLSSRYANSSYQTVRAENVASVNSATRMYSDTLSYVPVIQNKLVLKVVGKERFIDNGAGILTGSLGGSGTIGYDDGAISITLGTNLVATWNMTASYFSGDTLDSQPYQIIADYTPYFRLPEVSPTDGNSAYIYTKALRMIDEKLYNASQNTASVGDITLYKSLKSKAVSKAASYVATSANRWIIVAGNAASIGVKLYNASSKNKFKEVFIINNSTYTVRIRRQNSDLVNASQIIKLKTRYKTFHGYVATTNLWIRVQ